MDQILSYNFIDKVDSSIVLPVCDLTQPTTTDKIHLPFTRIQDLLSNLNECSLLQFYQSNYARHIGSKNELIESIVSGVNIKDLHIQKKRCVDIAAKLATDEANFGIVELSFLAHRFNTRIVQVTFGDTISDISRIDTDSDGDVVLSIKGIKRLNMKFESIECANKYILNTLKEVYSYDVEQLSYNELRKLALAIGIETKQHKKQELILYIALATKN
jgi:hypothetical protein